MKRNSIKASFPENSRLLFWEINAISFLFFSFFPPALTGKRITFESSSKSYSYIFGCSHPCDQILKVKVENQCQGGGAELCKGHMNETLSATNQERGWKSKSYYGTTIWTLFWNCEKSIWNSRKKVFTDLKKQDSKCFHISKLEVWENCRYQIRVRMNSESQGRCLPFRVSKRGVVGEQCQSKIYSHLGSCRHKGAGLAKFWQMWGLVFYKRMQVYYF